MKTTTVGISFITPCERSSSGRTLQDIGKLEVMEPGSLRGVLNSSGTGHALYLGDGMQTALIRAEVQ